MKEKPSPVTEMDIDTKRKKLFQALRGYFNGNTETESITDEEIWERIDKVYNKTDADKQT